MTQHPEPTLAEVMAFYATKDGHALCPSCRHFAFAHLDYRPEMIRCGCCCPTEESAVLSRFKRVSR